LAFPRIFQNDRGFGGGRGEMPKVVFSPKSNAEHAANAAVHFAHFVQFVLIVPLQVMDTACCVPTKRCVIDKNTMPQIGGKM
jgi:hypothetical protein